MNFINFQTESKLFSLRTLNTQRVFYCDSAQRLIQLYYGTAADGNADFKQLEKRIVHSSFSPVPEHEGGPENSPDDLLQVFPGFDCGDYRLSAAIIRDSSGVAATDFRYHSHSIYSGCAIPENLPGADRGKFSETLEITLRDPARPIECKLYFTVFPECDIIAQFAVISNRSDQTVKIERITGAVLDLYGDEYDQLFIRGSYPQEFQLQRVPLHPGLQIQRSLRGATGHHANPAVALLDKSANETYGNVYGAVLLYSGNFSVEVECSQYHNTRLTMGIAETDFAWLLKSNESFTTPETAFTYSDCGIGKMSRNFHDFFRYSVIPEVWESCPRPLLCNSWEAMRFDFNREGLLQLADAAASLGVEMLVLDDGWFGERNEADCSLGDWFVNTAKVGSLASLAEELNKRDLKFGLWFEPEMISRKSKLFEQHPDWVLGVPGRDLSVGRNQLVLDMTRDDVVDYLFECMSKLISEAGLSYIKWDMNRNLSEVYSQALPPEQQCEARHRYLLGVYKLHDRLLKRFPELLIEGCSGGGGRFDGGMLHYCGQLWTSDNTDAAERLSIQFGASIFYPPCVIGSHAASNYPGQSHSFEVRCAVADFGTSGYEMRLDQLAAHEKIIARENNLDYRKNHTALVEKGSLYRLTASNGTSGFVAWMQISPDQRIARLTVIRRQDIAENARLCLQGLAENLLYTVNGRKLSGKDLMTQSFDVIFDDDNAEAAAIIDFIAD